MQTNHLKNVLTHQVVESFIKVTPEPDVVSHLYIVLYHGCQIHQILGAMVSSYITAVSVLVYFMSIYQLLTSQCLNLMLLCRLNLCISAYQQNRLHINKTDCTSTKQTNFTIKFAAFSMKPTPMNSK